MELNIPPATCVGDNEVPISIPIFSDWAANQFENRKAEKYLYQNQKAQPSRLAFSIPQIYFESNYHSFGGVLFVL